MAICPSCIDYIKSYKSTCRILDNLGCTEREQAPKEVPEDLIQAILKARRAGQE